MAVPKRKTSKSKRGMRRSQQGLKPVNVVVDAVTGEAKLPHHLSLADGYYNGREVFTFKQEDDTDETKPETL